MTVRHTPLLLVIAALLELLSPCYVSAVASTNRSSSNAAAVFEPIRCLVNSTLLLHPSLDRTSTGGNRSCTDAAANSRWCDATNDCTHRCSENDVVNASSIAAVLSAVGSAFERVGSMLRVNRASSVALLLSNTPVSCEDQSVSLTQLTSADHVVLLAMRPVTPVDLDGVTSPLQLPWGAMCAASPLDGRPVVSLVNVPPALMMAGPSYAATAVLRIVLQVLGFSYDSVASYLAVYPNITYAAFNSNVYPYGALRVVGADGVSPPSQPPTSDPSSNWPDYSNAMTATTRLMVVTPSVVAAARLHFGCPSMQGVLLEEYNSDALDMRWERRVLGPELMTSELYAPPAAAVTSPLGEVPLTALTVAMFADMGFYQVSDDFEPDPMLWGYQRGCSFPQVCTASSWSTAFCGSAAGLSLDATSFALCDIRNYSDGALSAAPYRHFAAPLSDEGGADPYADYCPLMSSDKVLCTTSSSDTAVDSVLSNRTCWGCRAVVSSVVSIDFVSPSTLFPRCMEVLCLNASLLMVRVGDQFLPCAPPSDTVTLGNFWSAGGSASSPGNDFLDYQFYGSVNCSAALALCNPSIEQQSDALSLYRTRSSSSGLVGPVSLNASWWPEIVSIAPTEGFVSGGDRVTVVGRHLGPGGLGCRGVLIGGQPTDVATFVYGGSADSGAGLESFSVNTTAVTGPDGSSSSSGLLRQPADASSTTRTGGLASDGSGVVDVVLLCNAPPFSIQCSESFGGLCGFSRLRSAFTLLPRPTTPPEPYWLDNISAQIGVGVGFACFTVCSVALMFRFCRATYAPPLVPDDCTADDGRSQEMLLHDNDVRHRVVLPHGAGHTVSSPGGYLVADGSLPDDDDALHQATFVASILNDVEEDAERVRAAAARLDTLQRRAAALL